MNHKAKLVLSHDVYRKIEWLTHNYDKEIGAVGVGKMRTHKGEKQFYVEKLFFPKQKVSSATVHFTAEMWTNLLQNKEFMERMGDMCFYWHKHPGSATHSSTDEEDTFETFMDPIAKRKWFGFLQTASKDNGKSMDTEARIELATPLRVSIEKSNIDLLFEHSPKKLELLKLISEEKEATKVEMESLIEEVIDKTITTTPSTWNDNNKEVEKKNEEGVKYLFGTYEEKGETLYMDNDIVSGFPTSDEEKASIKIDSGQARIKTGKLFEKVLLKALNDDKSPLKPLVKKFNPTGDSKGMIEYILQPHKKQYMNMKKELETIFIQYNVWLEKKLIEEEIKEATDTGLDYNFNVNKYSKSYWQLIGEYAVWQFIGELESNLNLIWDTTGKYCKVFNPKKDKDMIGTILVNDNCNIADLKGDLLINEVSKKIDNLLDDTYYGSKINEIDYYGEEDVSEEEE